MLKRPDPYTHPSPPEFRVFNLNIAKTLVRTLEKGETKKKFLTRVLRHKTSSHTPSPYNHGRHYCP